MPSRLFFQHKTSNGFKKLVTALKTDNGRVIDSASIMQEQLYFYKSIYTAQFLYAHGQEESLNFIEGRMSEVERLSLEAFLSEEECLLALHAISFASGTPYRVILSQWLIIVPIKVNNLTPSCNYYFVI